MRIRTVFLIVWILCLALAAPAAAQEVTPEATPVTPELLADADGQFVELDGISVYYREVGPADGPPVLLLHGFLGSSSNWDATLYILGNAGYRTIAFDRPPFGLSDKRPELDYSLEAQAALTAALMDELGIEQAALIGHSAGGAVVSQFALAYPERVTRLVLVAGAVGLNADSGTADTAVGRTFSFLVESDPNSPVARLALRAMFNGPLARNMLGQAVNNPDLMTPEMAARNARFLQLTGWEAGLLAFARDTRWDKPELEALAQVKIPVLLQWGEADRIVPLEVGERLRGIFPDVTWKTYPDTGHIPMLEANDAFHGDLLDFLAA